MKKWLTALIIFLLPSLAGAAYLARHEHSLAYQNAPWLSDVRSTLRDVAKWIRVQPAWEPKHTNRYITARAETGKLRQTITASGTLNAVTTVDVGSQLSGQIAKLFVDFNDVVKRGQPLAQLDQQSFEARVAEAKAAIEMTQAALEIQKAKIERAEVDLRDAEAQRTVLRARTDNAKVRLTLAESTARRKQQLAERGAGSSARRDDALAQRDSAMATLRETEALQAAHKHAIAGAKVDVERARAELGNVIASLPQKQAQLRLAEIDLERATIRSPIDGLVLGREVEEGQTVAASLEAPTLFTIAGDLQNMKIDARVDETDIGHQTSCWASASHEQSPNEGLCRSEF